MQSNRSPGVTLRDRPLAAQPVGSFSTATAAFIGVIPDDLAVSGQPSTHEAGEVTLFTDFNGFQRRYGGFAPAPSQNHLAHAVYGFFTNGGERCYVVHEASEEDIIGYNTLEKLASIEEIAILAAPGITNPAVVSAVDSFCQQPNRHCFAILDGPQHVNPAQLVRIVAGATPTSGTGYNLPAESDSAGLYYPWLLVRDPDGGPGGDGLIGVPPSGHIAGIYARSDRRYGVHKAPANEIVEGALDLGVLDEQGKWQPAHLTGQELGALNEKGVNGLRALPGRGIRVWGARTLSSDPIWRYINVRRLLLSVARWIELNMAGIVFEPHTPLLWRRITRDLTAYCDDLLRQGALKGSNPQEAYYVRCDEDLNPPQVRDTGRLVVEIGLAPSAPYEFVVIQMVRGDADITITGLA